MLNRFLISLYYVISSIIQSIAIIMSVYIIMGWIVAVVRPKSNNAFVRIYSFLDEKIDPIFAYCRQFIPPIMGLDFSAILVFLAIEGLHYILGLLVSLLMKL